MSECLGDFLHQVLYLILLYEYFGFCMYGHTYSESRDDPGKVANPARDHRKREN